MGDLKHDIERYIRGEMSSAERHHLEMLALSDPFLADALDGAESEGIEEFTSDVNELKRRINAPQHTKKTPVFPLRIAASLGLLLIVSSLLYYFLRPAQPVMLSKVETVNKDLPAATPRQPDSVIKEKENETPPKDLLSLNAPAPPKIEQTLRTTEASGKKSAPITEPEPASSGPKITETKTEQSTPAVIEEEVIVVPATKSTPSAYEAFKKEDAAANKDLQPAGASRRNKSTARVIEGNVKSEDGTPLSGANVVVTGTNTGTVTDAKGDYKISTDSPERSLAISSIGFKTREVEVAGKSKLDIELQDDVNSSSEVVVSNYGLAQDNDDDLRYGNVDLASPKGGNKAFDDYLKKNLRYPPSAIQQKVAGNVTVEFMVKRDGTLTDFTIIRSLQTDCDEELIRLIREGPGWIPNKRNGESRDSKVRIRQKFSLPE